MGNLSGEEGKSLKFNVEKQTWSDFTTGDSGSDFVSLWMAHKGLDFPAALDDLLKEEGLTATTPVVMRPPPERSFPKDLHGTMYWTYYGGDAKPIAYVQRVDRKDGGKDYYPRTWDGKGWARKQIPKNRPLYNLPKVLLHDAILLVEGEKAADAAQRFLEGKMAATTWMGGSNAYKKTNWKNLKNKRALLWPDADDAGRKAMLNIADMIYGMAGKVWIIDTSDLPEKYDAADSDFKTLAEFKAWSDLRSYDYQPRGMDIIEESVESSGGDPEAAKEDLLESIRTGDYPQSVSLKKIGMLTGANGAAPAIFHNAYKYLQHFHKDEFWFDLFKGRIMTTFKVPKGSPAVPLSDVKVLHVMGILQKRMFKRLTKTVAREAIDARAEENKRNSMKEWLEGLKWDGRKRVLNLVRDCLGSLDCQYNKDVSRYLMLAMVARMVRPGTKADMMPILEGQQGVKKSTFLEVLAGGEDYHITETGRPDSDMVVRISGKLIVEIAELMTLKKAHIDKFKGLMTSRNDDLRKAYAREVSTLPRTAIFVGTTNDKAYLTDTTGNRRFLPVKVGNVNIDLLKETREQLFAEAYQMLKDGVEWWDVSEEAGTVRYLREHRDMWTDIIIPHLKKEVAQARTWVSVAQLAKSALGMEARDMTPAASRRIEKIIERAGWERDLDKYGVLRYKYIKKEEQ